MSAVLFVKMQWDFQSIGACMITREGIFVNGNSVKPSRGRYSFFLPFVRNNHPCHIPKAVTVGTAHNDTRKGQPLPASQFDSHTPKNAYPATTIPADNTRPNINASRSPFSFMRNHSQKNFVPAKPVLLGNMAGHFFTFSHVTTHLDESSPP